MALNEIMMPSLCQLLLKDEKSLCSSPLSGLSIPHSTSTERQLYESTSVVTILRLKPGTFLLPHCGITNSRLIMHISLSETNGVELTDGDKMIKRYIGGVGHGIVFDDSY